MEKRDFSKAIGALLKTIEKEKKEISSLEEKQKDARTFEFIKGVCGSINIFCDENCNVVKEELADALITDLSETDSESIAKKIHALKIKMKNCYALVDKLKELQLANSRY